MFIIYFHSGTVGVASGGLTGRKKWLYIPININVPSVDTPKTGNSKETSVPNAD